MAGEEVTILRICGSCGAELESFSVRKENMMLCSDQSIWCPHCKTDTPELRDIAGRLDSIAIEQGSYPSNAALS